MHKAPVKLSRFQCRFSTTNRERVSHGKSGVFAQDSALHNNTKRSIYGDATNISKGYIEDIHTIINRRDSVINRRTSVGRRVF